MLSRQREKNIRSSINLAKILLKLDINTVAAGGGSMLFFRSGLFVVGPESAGANPGPACYKKGGPLTVTDANLVLGRLLPEYFPKIFGPNEDEPLDKDVTLEAFRTLSAEVTSSYMIISSVFFRNLYKMFQMRIHRRIIHD